MQSQARLVWTVVQRISGARNTDRPGRSFAHLAFGAALLTLLSACGPMLPTTQPQPSFAEADLLVYGVSARGEKGEFEIDFGTVKVGEHSIKEIRVCNEGDVWFLRSDIVFREPAGYATNWAGIWDDGYVVSGECLEWAHIIFAPTTGASYNGIVEVTANYPGAATTKLRVSGTGTAPATTTSTAASGLSLTGSSQ
jgi:hypothetical protein